MALWKLDMKAEHDALVDDWRQNAARHEDRNFRCLRSLKMVSDPEHIDELAHDLHKDAFGKIDCTRCANCCKTLLAITSSAFALAKASG
jgi:hypothetical protein